MIQIVKGNLITMALEGAFEVVGHGCNCFCRMKRGIAPQMVEVFGCDTFSLEERKHEGDVRKLGNIDYRLLDRGDPLKKWTIAAGVKLGEFHNIDLAVVNMYTQYHWTDPDPRTGIPLSYTALAMCLQKMNRIFAGKNVGLPWIGCGLAGGDKDIVLCYIEDMLSDCNVTIVELENQ